MSLRVLGLHAEAFKRIQVVDITPDPSSPMVVIAGNNAQGKTSVIDAIWAAIGGRSYKVDQPVREGEREAEVTVDLGEIVVKRRWKAGARSTLEVKAANGARINSAQAVLDSLVGRFSFDPLAFAEMDAKRQRDMLLEVVQLPFDPDELAAQRQALYDQRTDANRDVRRLEGVLQSMPRVPDSVPNEERSAVELLEKVTAIETGIRELDATTAEHARIQRRIQELQRELDEHRELLASVSEVGNRQWEALQRLTGGHAPAPEIAQRLRSQLASLDETNARVRAKNARAAAEAELAQAEARSESLTAQIAELDQAKANALAQVVMPVPGLSFSDDGVLYNGVPFSQASGAERLRVSLGIAMALNPKLRVIRISDGSLLDNDNLALIEQMARDQDFQVWIERVGTDEVGVIIEDGMVKA